MAKGRIVKQTIKIARVRAASDPDRDAVTPGTYYGSNLPGVYVSKSWTRRMRVTRGVFVCRGTS